MVQTNFKSIIEDSSRNKFLFYYSGTSVCCKEISKDGISRDTIIASQVKDNFLVALDLHDNIHVVCLSEDKGIYLFSYVNSEWKLEQILNIQGNGNIYLLSLFLYNGCIHIIYAKEMTIANFYNIYHVFKPGNPSAYHINTSWRKNNVCEMYAEKLDSAFSSVLSKDGVINIVNEWYDGSSYLINYCWYDSLSDSWKKKSITTLFKKDITVNILYEDSNLHLLCYTFEEEVSAIFCYTKKDGLGKDFEFFSLDKIMTEQAVNPSFHIESGGLYASWIRDNNFSQYVLNREQKNWSKKLDSAIPSSVNLQLVEYLRNRKGKALIVKKTYFSIDYKHNISLPYFKDSATESSSSTDNRLFRNAEGDLVRYIPYLLDEIKSLAQAIKAMDERLDQYETVKKHSVETKTFTPPTNQNNEIKVKQNETVKLKKSSFKEQFMGSNKLIGRPEATALYVGSSALPSPDEISKKEGIEFAENTSTKNIEKPEVKLFDPPPEDTNQPKLESDANVQKDNNIFKKIGEFFK